MTAKPADERIPLETDAVKVYIKQNVETFLFRGADLMWPGVLSVSQREFKPNSTGVVYAHKDLVKKYISSLKDAELNKDDSDGDNAEEQKDATAATEESKDNDAEGADGEVEESKEEP